MLIESFDKIYLAELPQRLDSSAIAYDVIYQQISELASNKPSKALGNNVFSVVDSNTHYYWVGSADGSVVDVAVSLDVVAPGSATVDLSAKNPNLIGGPPYASDLYLIASDDLGKRVRFTSGKILSSDGIGAWRRLFKDGHVTSVYDNKLDKYVVTKVASIDDLEHYWKEHPDYQQYQYVLSEASEAAFIGADFAIMEWKRLSGWLA